MLRIIATYVVSGADYSFESAEWNRMERCLDSSAQVTLSSTYTPLYTLID